MYIISSSLYTLINDLVRIKFFGSVTEAIHPELAEKDCMQLPNIISLVSLMQEKKMKDQMEGK